MVGVVGVILGVGVGVGGWVRDHDEKVNKG